MSKTNTLNDNEKAAAYVQSMVEAIPMVKARIANNDGELIIDSVNWIMERYMVSYECACALLAGCLLK